MIKAALFDYDGTLVDTDIGHLACWNQALKKYGTSIDEEFFAAHCVGALTLHIVEQIKKEIPGVSGLAQALADEKDAFYEQWIATNTMPTMPGVSELLNFLSAEDVKIGIVTGAPLAAIQKTLEEHALIRFFDPIVTRESVGRGKPAPDGYLFALQQLGCAAGEAVSFEDTRVGVLAARAAGMVSFAIPSGFTTAQDFSAADVVCKDLFAARAALVEMMAAGPRCNPGG